MFRRFDTLNTPCDFTGVFLLKVRYEVLTASCMKTTVVLYPRRWLSLISKVHWSNEQVPVPSPRFLSVWPSSAMLTTWFASACLGYGCWKVSLRSVSEYNSVRLHIVDKIERSRWESESDVTYSHRNLSTTYLLHSFWIFLAPNKIPLLISEICFR
jgi:hypothetical protein